MHFPRAWTKIQKREFNLKMSQEGDSGGPNIKTVSFWLKKKIKPPVLNKLKENCYPPSFWAAVIFHVSRKIAKVLALDNLKLKCWKGERIPSIVVIYVYLH